MRKWDVRRYTLSQILNALRDHDAETPGVPIKSTDELDEMWDELFPDG